MNSIFSRNTQLKSDIASPKSTFFNSNSDENETRYGDTMKKLKESDILNTEETLLKHKTTIFKKGKSLERARCCSRVFFTWVKPLINYANKHGKLSLEMLGNLRPQDKVE